MSESHLLQADAISKFYGNVVALKGISMHVNGGEVTCILGDNGAGKSSFIKILSGSHQPDGGRLVIDGDEVACELREHLVVATRVDHIAGSFLSVAVWCASR